MLQALQCQGHGRRRPRGHPREGDMEDATARCPRRGYRNGVLTHFEPWYRKVERQLLVEGQERLRRARGRREPRWLVAAEAGAACPYVGPFCCPLASPKDC